VTLATAGYDRQIRFWSPSNGTCRHHIMFAESVRKRKRRIYLFCMLTCFYVSGVFRICSVCMSKFFSHISSCLFSLHAACPSLQQINRLAISPQKNIIAAAGNPLAKLFDINTSSATFTCEGHTGNVTAVGFQRLGKWLYTASEDAHIKIWDPRVRGSRRSSTNSSPINDVVLHPNQAEIISVCRDGSVQVWDLVANRIKKSIPAVSEGEDSSLQTVSVMADASLLVAASNSGHVHVWDIANDYKFVRSFQAHRGYILKCQFSPDLRCLATTSSDSTVKLWSTKDHKFDCIQTLASHSKWVWDCAFSADSSYLLTSSSDCSAKLWELQRGIVIRNFTPHHKAVVAVALNDTDKVKE
jgi:target of rapamycin complex subunit LST8